MTPWAHSPTSSTEGPSRVLCTFTDQPPTQSDLPQTLFCLGCFPFYFLCFPFIHRGGGGGRLMFWISWCDQVLDLFF